MSDDSVEKGKKPKKQIELPISGQTLRLNLDLNLCTHEAIYNASQGGWVYEPITVLTLSKFLEPGDVFIDGGSHIGYYSLVAAAIVGSSGKVLAFEPNPTNYSLLVEHVQLNQFSNIIYPLQCALGDKVGSVTLYENKANDGGHALWSFDGHGEVKGLWSEGGSKNVVQQVTIDCITEKLSLRQIKAIKLDVEGAEVPTLRGALKSIAKLSIELIIVEVHVYALQAMGSSVPEMLKILTELGYVGFSAPEGSYNRITFDENYQPTGQWWKYHQFYIENLYFIHRSSSKLSSFVSPQIEPPQR